MSRFTGPLIIQFDKKASDILNGEYWRVMQDFDFVIPASHIANEWVSYDSGAIAHVSRGQLTDLGSVPKLLRGIVSEQGDASQAFVLHDQLCEYLSITKNGAPFTITRQEADLILRDALIDLGVPHERATFIYNMVAAYQIVNNISARSTFALKRELEAEYYIAQGAY